MFAISSSDNIGATMICDEEYPKRVAIDFLIKIIDNFKIFIKEKKIDLNLYTVDTDIKYDYIKNEIENWQDPAKNDNIMKLKDELNDQYNIMTKNINELMKREENLDSPILKSEEFSKSTKTFYIKEKKTNRCCNF